MDDEKDTEMHGRMLIALECLKQCREFSGLVPEVRTNIVYARENAKSPKDVIAIDGRITVVDGMPHPSGKPKFGASSHMARLIIELKKYDSSIRAGINFANTPEIVEWLKQYCKSKNWMFSVIDRDNEPDEIKEKEGASMPWKIAETVRAAGGVAPKVFYETGAIGKEPVSVLVGKGPVEVVRQMCEISREWSKTKDGR